MKGNSLSKTFRPDRVLSYFKSEIGVLAVVTVSGIIYNIGMAAGPWFEGQLVQRLYDIITGAKAAETMLSLALLYLLVIACIQGSRAVKRYSVRIFANNVSRSMRHVLYHSLVYLNAAQLKHENTGSLMTKAIADVDVCVEGMRKFTTEVFDTGVVMVVYLTMLFALDWRLTILVLLFMPVAYIVANCLKKVVSSANSAYKKSASWLNLATMDRVGNAVTYRIFGREDSRNQAYKEQLEDYANKSTKANIFEGSLGPLYDCIAMIGVALILYFGSRNVVGSGWTAWDIAYFTTYLACFTKLATKVSHAAKLFNAVQKASVSWQRIKPLMEKVGLVADSFGVLSAAPAELRFEGVNCGYEVSEADETGGGHEAGGGSGQAPAGRLLSGVTFAAQPGEIVGVTGVVASGKSLLGKTLIDLVPWDGDIYLGGKSFAQMTIEEKRASVAYMGHEPELLSTTMEDNITLGDDLGVSKWLAVVRLDDEVKQMPKGAQTLVGMDGAQLSGGQQARLALARTLSHAKPVIVLDDPLSAVDRTTEAQILDNIRKELPQAVILLISHRLYHFPELDHVLFLHDGTASFGTHDEIAAQAPAYAALYEKQLTGGDLDED